MARSYVDLGLSRSASCYSFTRARVARLVATED